MHGVPGPLLPCQDIPFLVGFSARRLRVLLAVWRANVSRTTFIMWIDPTDVGVKSDVFTRQT